MNLGIAVMFTGVGAAMIANGAAARRAPERAQDAKLLFASGALFLIAAFAFSLTYLFD